MTNPNKALTLCSVLASFLAAPTNVNGQDRAVLSQAGEWRFELDPESKGIRESWFNRSLADTVWLPGTTDTNHKGVRNDKSDAERLSRKWTYTGKAWYQRNIDVPASWAGRRVILCLERTRVTRVWLNGDEIGSKNVRLSAPHIYELSGKAVPGRHRLSVMVDNGEFPGFINGHLVIEDTQTNWNGILGRIELIATGQVWIESLRATPDVKRRNVAVSVRIRNATGKAFLGKVSLSAESFNTIAKDKASYGKPVEVSVGDQTVEVNLAMGTGMLTWDEFRRN